MLFTFLVGQSKEAEKGMPYVFAFAFALHCWGDKKKEYF
jgi:hypothetical protein